MGIKHFNRNDSRSFCKGLEVIRAADRASYVEHEQSTVATFVLVHRSGSSVYCNE